MNEKQKETRKKIFFSYFLLAAGETGGTAAEGGGVAVIFGLNVETGFVETVDALFNAPV